MPSRNINCNLQKGVSGMRGKSKVGEVRGDFKVLERTGRHYKCKCVHCGAIREYSETSINSGKMKCQCPHEVTKLCRQCRKEFTTLRNALFCSVKCKNTYYNDKRQKGVHIYKMAEKADRCVNETTRMLVCVYTEEGLSVKEIAMWLKRSESVIRKILTVCRENGKYDFFINNSPILQIRGKKKCT